MNQYFQIRICSCTIAATVLLLAFATTCSALPPEEKLWNQPPVTVKPPSKLPTLQKVDMASAIEAYNHGQFGLAKTQFQTLLLNDLTNGRAHYYYAACLAKAGEHSAASYEYEMSLRYSRDKNMIAYAQQAIRNLHSLAAAERAEIKKSVPKGTNQHHFETTAEKAKLPGATRHLDQQAERLLGQLNADYEHKKKEWQRDLDRAVHAAEIQLADDIAARPGQKTEYETRAGYKIRILKIDAQEPLKLIEEDHAKKLTAFLSAHENLKGQMRAKGGSSQVVPANTNLTVRNYMNFGGVREKERKLEPISPGLRATAGALNQPHSKSSQHLHALQARM